MTQRAIRFGIHDGNNRRAATWKLWTEIGSGNSEVYLANRSLGGTIKASLHQSGKWHIAFTRKVFEEQVKGIIPKFKDRFVEKWPRPQDIAPGFTLVFRIVTPHSAVTSSISQGKFRRVIWLPNASKSRATEIYIIITKANSLVTGWPGKRSMGTSLIDSFELENGDRVWAVYWEIDQPNLSKSGSGTGWFFKGKSKTDLNTDTLTGC